MPPTTGFQQATKTLREQLEAANQRGELLGLLCSWSVDKVLIPRDQLRAMLGAHNLPTAIPAIGQTKAISRALEAMMEDGWVRRTADDDERMTYQWLYTQVDKDQTGGDEDKVRVFAEVRVTVNKKAGPGTDPLRITPPTYDAEVRAKIAEYADSYTARDISRFIIAEPLAQECYSFGASRMGGCYFVPTQARERAIQLKEFVAELAQSQWCKNADGTYITMIRVANDETERLDLQRHAKDALAGQLDELERRLDQLGKRSEKVKPETVASYVGQVDDLMNATQLYCDLLRMDATEIEGRRTKLRGAFSALHAASLTRVPAPAAPKAGKVSFEAEPEPEPVGAPA